MRYEYFKANETEEFTFYRIPKALFMEDAFRELSMEARMLYGLMLDRMTLSRMNGWIDEQGHVFIIYTIEELCRTFHRSTATIVKLMKRLDESTGIGLIRKRKQGRNKPNIIYVKNFMKPVGGGKEDKSKLSDGAGSDRNWSSNIWNPGVPDVGTQEVKNLESLGLKSKVPGC